MFTTRISWMVVLLFVLVGAAISTCAHADGPWSLKLGAGRATYQWCGPNGCWHQPPLPYYEDNKARSFYVGTQYQMTPNLGIEGLYHDFGITRASGTYTMADADYDPHSGYVRPGCLQTNESMTQRTRGISLALVPSITANRVTMYGKFGLLWWREQTQWNTYGYQADYREGGTGHTPMIGIGANYRVGRYRVGLELTGYQDVLYKNAPFGGHGTSMSRPGLTETMATIAYSL